MQELYNLGLKHGATKISHKSYFVEYSTILAPMRDKNIKLLEIGVDLGGSHRMWKEYLPNADIFCFDPFKDGQDVGFQEQLEKEGIKTFNGNQLDREHLNNFIKKYGRDFDVIIDDAAHMPDAQQTSLGFLFPYLKSGGVYFIEDLLSAQSRQGRMIVETGQGKEAEVNKNIKGILDIPHVVDYQIHESNGQLKLNNRWKSNTQLTEETDYLTENIFTCKFTTDSQLCTIIKK